MAAHRSNVLFIPVDDLRPQLGCYGRRQMITPNIDALAESGVFFTQAYCQAPVCGASRASLLTGVRPTPNRFVNYRTWVDEDLPGALTLPEYFRKNGYITVSLGKVFHHRTDTAARSWSVEPWQPNPGGNWRNYLLPENVRCAEQQGNGRGPAYEAADVDDEAYFDGQIAARAVAELERLAAENDPFFLAVGFLKPHLPFNAPRKYWDYYRREHVNPADNPWPPENCPREALHNWGELRQYVGIPPEGPLPEDLAQTLVHGYYAAVSYVDAQIGRLLAALDRLGLKENTIVVLWGDHGWQLGEHGLWCKHCNFKTSLNAPLIIRAPGLARGRSCNGLVEFVDIFPTLCDLAGITLPDGLMGRSLAPLLEDPLRPGKQAVFSRYMRGDSIRCGPYLYTQWRADDGTVTARMLYDHERDPDENHNIAEVPHMTMIADRLRQMLEDGWRAVDTPL